jgi:ATP-binding cassette subfamily B (MDR/TAP) protein 1
MNCKSVQATNNFRRLLKLEINTEDSRGVLLPELVGPITFNHVGFSYPERADAFVLKDITLLSPSSVLQVRRCAPDQL